MVALPSFFTLALCVSAVLGEGCFSNKKDIPFTALKDDPMPAVHAAIDSFCDGMIKDGHIPASFKDWKVCYTAYARSMTLAVNKYLDGGTTPDSERCKAGLKGAALCDYGGIHILDGDHYPWWSFESRGHWEYTADPNDGACDPGLAWGGNIF
ncbi:hypothetical protein AK830_g12519 [Neonectria ditissima]|uniref:Small putative-secreted protein n=1 Tax=Neonectria ditissima TaxID=78410 RepID=A0A0P7APG4_9HYPO|nr:hypothetical protein AK830_g12519 [Neonectria ditissima]QPG92867.1 small putative-secreted protein [Neonectria ditissima]